MVIAARHARTSRGEVDRHQRLNIVRIAVAYFFGNTLVHMPRKTSFLNRCLSDTKYTQLLAHYLYNA